MLNQLNSMRSQIVNSIQTTPLSELHQGLHKRRDKLFPDLFDWRTDHYPSTNTAVRQDDQYRSIICIIFTMYFCVLFLESTRGNRPRFQSAMHLDYFQLSYEHY